MRQPRANLRANGLPPWKKRFFAVSTVLFTPVFFLSLELALRLFHYGTEYDLVLTTSRLGKQYYRINPTVGRRYFDPQQYSLPEIDADDFEILKSPRTCRVFVLGESTTAGFPYKYNATPSYILRKLLERAWPEENFEIINVSLTATNSYTVLEFIDQLMHYKPDAFIIYSGQNEFYGALGVGSTISLGRERWMIRAYQQLWNLKIFVLLHDALMGVSSWIPGAKTGRLTGTMMNQMAKDRAIPFHSDLYNKARDAYEQNLHASAEIAGENNIPVIVSTLVTNERSLAPFESMHSESLDKVQKSELSSLLQGGDKLLEAKDYVGAAAAYRKMISTDSSWAMAYYKLGKCYDGMEKFDSARTAYDKACDLDGLRFRASSEFNGIIRRLAKRPNVIVADADSSFRTNSANGIIGKELLWEHVHPNLHGYMLMAETWFDALMRSALFSSSSHERSPRPLSDSLFVASLKITPLDLEIGAATMSILLQRWPFTDTSLATIPKSADEVQRVAQLFMSRKLRWNEAHFEMAEVYLRRKDFVSAVKEYEAVNALDPDDPFPLMRMGDLYLLLRNEKKAEQAYRELISLGENPVARFKLGVTYLKLERLEAALKQLSTAIEVNDRSSIQLTREEYEEVMLLYASALYKSAKSEDALRVLATLLRLNPGDVSAMRLAQEIRSGKKK
jgi:tetratricopeptide (TPR) repeat protein